jgi:hypothetical protein
MELESLKSMKRVTEEEQRFLQGKLALGTVRREELKQEVEKATEFNQGLRAQLEETVEDD